MIKSKREQSSSFGTPLKKFTGKVTGISTKERTGKFSKAGDLDIIMSFDDVKVLEADAAYPYTVAEFPVCRFSDAATSALVVLEDSIALALNMPVEDVCVDLLNGKEVTMERQDDYLFFTRNDGSESRGKVWRVLGVNGAVGGVDSRTAAIELLNGKTRGQFVQEAISNPAIRGDSGLVKEITSFSFFEADDVKAVYVEEADGFKKR